VRAFPSSEHGGDQGQAVSAEWRWRALPNLVLTAFADAGRVVQLAQPSVPRQALVLQGAGLNLSWQGPRGVATQLTWARRTAGNPQPTLSGTDGDGTLVRNRVWLTVSLPF
jgi:hemolysin activation/secretion protein